MPDVVQAAHDADVLIFVVPHQFIGTLCRALAGRRKPSAVGISLIKGLEMTHDLKLVSQIISESLGGMEMSVLMGANIANEVAEEKFCETTIGCKNPAHAGMYKRLFETPYFRVSVVDEIAAVELCGALKNIVALGAGFVDGLGYGDNTKAAIIRIGLLEMIKFIRVFFNDVHERIFLESCGVADLITTCYGGRNRRVAEAFARTGKSFETLEAEMLNGQKLQGTLSAKEVYQCITARGLLDEYVRCALRATPSACLRHRTRPRDGAWLGRRAQRRRRGVQVPAVRRHLPDLLREPAAGPYHFEPVAARRSRPRARCKAALLRQRRRRGEEKGRIAAGRGRSVRVSFARSHALCTSAPWPPAPLLLLLLLLQL